MNQVADHWKDYECIDAGNGEKLERWKDIILRRPDPQVIWPIDKEDQLWKSPHAHYHRSKSGGDDEKNKNNIGTIDAVYECISFFWNCTLRK